MFTGGSWTLRGAVLGSPFTFSFGVPFRNLRVDESPTSLAWHNEEPSIVCRGAPGLSGRIHIGGFLSFVHGFRYGSVYGTGDLREVGHVLGVGPPSPKDTASPNVTGSCVGRRRDPETRVPTQLVTPVDTSPGPEDAEPTLSFTVLGLLSLFGCFCSPLWSGC